MQYIEITGWDEHLPPESKIGPSGPVWIRFYVREMSRDEFFDLSYAARGFYLSLCLEYGQSGGNLPADLTRLGKRLGQQVRQSLLDQLVAAGRVRIVDRPETDREPTGDQPETRRAPPRPASDAPERATRGTRRGPQRREEERRTTPTTSNSRSPRPKGKRKKHIADVLRIPYDEWIRDQTPDMLRDWEQRGYDTSSPEGGDE